MKHSVESIANALAFGETKLDDQGLYNYWQAVMNDVANDTMYGRTNLKNRRYLKAAERALQLRGLSLE